MNQKVKVGIIGFGRMGGFYLEEMQKSDQWEVLYICDTDPEARDLARRKSPTSRIVADEQVVFDDPEVQVVGLFTLCIMWTFPGGMLDASLRHGMRRRSECGIILNLGGCKVTGHLRTGWYLI